MDVSSEWFFKITNLDTGADAEFFATLPVVIHGYGFYGPPGKPGSLSVAQIQTLFD